eukprot:gene24956-10614_t
MQDTNTRRATVPHNMDERSITKIHDVAEGDIHKPMEPEVYRITSTSSPAPALLASNSNSWASLKGRRAGGHATTPSSSRPDKSKLGHRALVAAARKVAFFSSWANEQLEPAWWQQVTEACLREWQQHSSHLPVEKRGTQAPSSIEGIVKLDGEGNRAQPVARVSNMPKVVELS